VRAAVGENTKLFFDGRSVYVVLAARTGDQVMRALPSIALALFALAPCFGATVEEIAERSMPSVVKIVTYDDTGAETGRGSGFFISPQKIITNEHVVDGAYSAEILTDEGHYRRITILNADKDMDLAILRVDAEDEIPLQINPDAELKPGQRVIAIGYPLGLQKALSDGLIAAVRTLDGIQWVQITAPISEGSSGSAVLDQEGRVIGVVCAGFDEGQNLNFAIGIETLTKFLAREETPRELKVAGSYLLWRAVAKWFETDDTDTEDTIVYITRTGSKYHRAGCRYLSKSKIPITLKEARQHYAPCSVCKPPR
jgi:S1-C subfamily serine protease